MNAPIGPDDSLSFHRHRRALLLVLLAFTALFGIFFIVINFFAGKYMLMAVEVAVSTFALALLPVVRRTPRLQRWSVGYLIVLYSGVSYALITPETSVSVFGWVLLMPVVAHLLIGRLWGGVLCAVFVPLAAAIFIWRFGTDPVFANPGSIANMVTITCCSYLLSYVYEGSRGEAERRLRRMASTDALTGLPNRIRLEQIYARHMTATRLPMAMLMVDLDHFKRINDNHGHRAGDKVLRAVAKTMKGQMRDADFVFRLGGEEFCILLPDTDFCAARQLAERTRTAIEALACHDCEVVLRLTASIGIAVSRDADEPLDNLLHAADQNLYRAKLGGRNQVIG
ncbi:GGDEF domain-containing protein [uncultured Salinisphaera sp.]|jgi:diguanylate cyclase (GGDEF)-like protein|uniref:GGDEF domain-containing protein n=1 Tax=uncultured Salinisphaera sp. TaxID=359372 RepID=UPI0032B27FDC